MAIEEFGQQYFTRDRVRNRMLKRAAELWGFSESEVDDFDPLVSLLIEACSVEFEKISGEIGKTQNRMLERLAKLLYPGMIDVSPAYGVIQVRSSEPIALLNPWSQFVYNGSANDRKRENQPTELFFSPIKTTKIFDGSIAYIGTARNLFSISDGVQKLHMNTATKKNVDLQHCIWLGLDLNEEMKSLDGISFFINWMNQPESNNWYPLLPNTEWTSDSNVLAHQIGLPLIESVSEPAMKLEGEFDCMPKIESHINELFNRQYITLRSPATIEQLKLRRRLYPVAFEELFDKKELQKLKEPLLWLEIRFPPIMPLEALDTILVSLNAIPVINRKLNKFTYKVAQSLNIVPLETDGDFLSIKEVTNSEGQRVKLIPFTNPAGLMPETYTLRYGVNRFDERSSYETLVNLTELLREESSYFSSLGEDFLIQNIRELNHVLARIEEKVKMQHKHQSPYPYLAIKAKQEGGMIMVEYWSCNGKLANKIPTGSRLVSYKSSSVLSNSLFFITSTYGGRSKFTDAEKIDQYKKSLLTHNRIVTLEDLKVFMQTELGNSVRSISYKKVYIKGLNPLDGFIRSMQILITPEPGSLDTDEWDQRLLNIRLKLERLSVNNIPYQLTLVSI
jgi:hypothetical protein